MPHRLAPILSKSRSRQTLFLLACLAAIFLLSNLVWGPVVGGFFGNYLLPAMMWGLLALLISKRLSRARPHAKRRHHALLRWLAFICGLAGAMALVVMGLFDGFGRSPYDHSLRGIIVNFAYLGILLAGMEITRSWLINAVFAKRPVFGIAFTGVLFSLLWFPVRRFTNFQDGLGAVKFIGGTYLPTLSENVLASYLAFLGGPLPAVIYRGTLTAFHWFSPVLPDLSWIMQALIGTFVPVFGMGLVYQMYRAEAVRGRRRREAESPIGWIVTSAASVLIIWFAVGVFSVFPAAIVSGSMAPAIDKGDVVIVKRIRPEQVAVGDVIQFREEHMRIAHRVVAIEEAPDGGPFFRTKGDANKNPDTDPVRPEQVVGKVVLVVPKAGWPAIALRSSD